VVLVAAGAAYYGTLQTLQANQDEAEKRLISDQVSKAFEHLGNTNSLMVRLGGIYALESVMNTSKQYYHSILEALSEFVRHGTKAEKGDGPPGTDMQAALTVIGRRRGGPDLGGADKSAAVLDLRQSSKEWEEEGRSRKCATFAKRANSKSPVGRGKPGLRQAREC
jgi:hypothetical protein